MNPSKSKVNFRPPPGNSEIWFARALFEFSPSVSDELNLEVGDVVQVHNKIDDFWMKGLTLNNGKIGQFPVDFVVDIAIPKHSKDEVLLYALDAFYPEVNGDLSFNKGDIIVLENKVNNEWGTGRSGNSNRGIFPLNYTAKLPSPKIDSFNKSSVRRKAPVVPLANKIKSTKGMADKSEVLGKAKAIMNLTAQLDEELSFQVGDEILITGVSDDGLWFDGKTGSESGSFPASFVKLEAPLKTSSTEQHHFSVDVSHDHNENKGWKEGDVDVVADSVVNVGNYSAAEFSKKQTKLTRNHKESEYFHTHEDSSKTQSDNVAEDATEKSTVKNILYTVEALHNFSGSSEQELSFHKGTIIPIYEEVDEHWFMGKVGDAEGYVARAYVSQTIEAKDSHSDMQSNDKKNFSSANSPVCDNNKTIVNNNENFNNMKPQTQHARQTVTNILRKHVDNSESHDPTENIEEGHQKSLDCGKRKALVMYDYDSRNQHDLSVTKGDIIWIIREVNSEWCKVENESKKNGIIPISYVEIIAEENSKSKLLLKNNTEKRNVNTVKDVADSTKKYSSQSSEMQQSCHESTVLSSVPEHCNVADSSSTRSLAFLSPKPFVFQKPNISRNYDRRNVRPRTLQKSTSVDIQKQPLSPSNSHRIRRSNSNPMSRNDTSPKDAMVHLKAWQRARKVSDVTTQNIRQESAIQEVCSENKAADSTRTSSQAVNRSSSMRERNSMKRSVDRVPSDPNFRRIRSNTNIFTDKITENGRPRSTSPRKRPTNVVNSSGNTTETSEDFSSTVSTTSSSSMDDPRSRLSDASSASNKSIKTNRTIQRSAPPIPPHSNDRAPTPEQTKSIWSPPVPQRKQSLQHFSKNKQEDYWSASPVQNEVNPGSLTPSRPAPQLPLPVRPPMPIQKKVAPQRPANPPKAGSISVHSNRTVNGGTQERVQLITTKEIKGKMEKLRSDIEEYTRMKRDLESLYQATLDGKERREISENLEFVKSNLRRLQNEFHNVIEGQQDHIYESIEVHMRPKTNTVEDGSLSAPPLPPAMESPGSIRKKRKERRLLVATELYNTEKDFLTDVTVTVEDIMNELIDRQIPQHIITTLFGNIVQIKEFSERFLSDLDRALKHESSPSSEKNSEDLTIGQVFIDNIPNMKDVYMPYCRNHDDSIAMVEKLENDAEFMQAVGYCLETVKNKVNVFDLGSFLIKPVQRFLKYPLLISELIKLTDPPSPNDNDSSDYDNLIKAGKMMQSVANDINEDKRTKDLVRKYKNAANEGLSEKLGKISMKSLKKKSTRLSRKLGQATGITTLETRDAQFEEVEKKFKMMERMTKMFLANVTSYCDKCRDVLCTELVVAKAIVDMVVDPESSHPVVQYQKTAIQMSGPLYRQFHDQVQLQVLSPIASLITSFKAPQTIITKRSDKLIDYEQLLKNSDSKEKTQAAKHDYEALNKSLLDELPKLCELGSKLLSSSIAIFARVTRDFEAKLLNALKPLVAMIQQSSTGNPKIISNLETYDRFIPYHIEAVQTISRLQIVPDTFGALYGAVSKTSNNDDSRRTSRTSLTNVKPQDSPTTCKRQSVEDRKELMQKHPKQLYVAEKNYTASQLMDIECCDGDLLAVLKKQDPMGNKNRWFVERGGGANATGFLPSTILRPFDPIHDDSMRLGSLGSPTSPSLGAKATPVPAPRTKSPTPSSGSVSSGHSSSTSGGTKPPLSPYLIRDTLKRGTNQKSMFSQLTDSDIIEAFAEEDEIFDDTEYGEVPATGTSPTPAKQHFRAQFDFTARSDLELTVHTGDIVKLIVAHDTDGNPEWWLVSNSDGKQGYVPSNYLTKAEYL
uniref:dynamin-binding protein-like isoform X2 n=1 Tax=Styela clava TaxID=7725 RepID=UPI001939C16C|nr:dynamin-binding protein-like isoform X2 [Styela clava]